MIKNIILIACIPFIFSCSSLIKYEKTKEEFKTEEFDKKVKIVEVEEYKGGVSPKEILTQKPAAEKKPAKVKKIKKPKKVEPEVSVPLKRQPDLEDSEGFDSQRRPLVDPFKIGEKVVHTVSYLGASAATMSFAVKPFAFVNGKKNYNFLVDIKTNSFFSRLYPMDDWAQIYLDYETLTPGAFKVGIRDWVQVKEARAYFDFDNLKADYWEHKYTEKDGHEEKKMNWTILPYSQNIFSAIFYMRVFKWTIGKECSFRVADNEKNVVFKGKAVEKTKLSTEAGEFNTIKIKAEVVARGKLAEAKDFYMWISDDDKKYVLRIEFKLPVGSLVSEAVEIREGN